MGPVEIEKMELPYFHQNFQGERHIFIPKIQESFFK